MDAVNEDGVSIVPYMHDRLEIPCAHNGCQLCQCARIWHRYRHFKFDRDREGRLAGNLHHSNGTGTVQTILPVICHEYNEVGIRIKPHRFHVEVINLDNKIWYSVTDHCANELMPLMTPQEFCTWWHMQPIEEEIYCG